METRTMLLVLGTSTLLLAVVLAMADAPAWGWAGVIVLGAVTMLGAVVTRRNDDEHGGLNS